MSPEAQIAALLEKKKTATIVVQTLGNFQLWRSDELVSSKDWGRAVVLQLFQFFITNRARHSLHKEQIIDRIWWDMDTKAGQQNFKVAQHGLNKVLEPNRKSRTEATFLRRQGLTYQLDLNDIWLDIEALDQLIAIGNQCLVENPELAKTAYREAIQLYQGIYLPNRLFEDWTTAERERIQLLTLGVFINLSELLLKENPLESVRLTQEALQIDPTWEDAYRIQMQAYLEKGNRPMAIKTYQKCVKILDKEFGLVPLPETKGLYEQIRGM